MALQVTGVTLKRPFNISPFTHRASMEYWVYFNEFNDHTESALACLGAVDPVTGLTTPSAKGQPLNSTRFPKVVVQDISIGPNEAGATQLLMWSVKVDYGEVDVTSINNAEQLPTFDKYPWQLDPIYDWQHVMDQSLMTVDHNGEAILNSNGDKLEEAIIVPRAVRTCVIEKNVPLNKFNPTQSLGYIDKVNLEDDTRVEGFPFAKNTLKCVAYDGKTQSANVTTGGQAPKVVQYKALRIEVHFDPLGWDGYYMDVGNNDQNGAILDKFGAPFLTPQRLNGNGVRLINADGTSNALQDGGKLDTTRSVAGLVAFLKYKKYADANLKELGI